MAEIAANTLSCILSSAAAAMLEEGAFSYAGQQPGTDFEGTLMQRPLNVLNKN